MVESDPPPLTEIFRALGDATRMQMLGDLATGEKTVSELAQPFAMSLAAASKHIRVLESAGLIEREVRWRTHVCRLKPEPLAEAHRWLGRYERFWTGRLVLLDQLLRQEDRAADPRETDDRKGQDDE